MKNVHAEVCGPAVSWGVMNSEIWGCRKPVVNAVPQPFDYPLPIDTTPYSKWKIPFTIVLTKVEPEDDDEESSVKADEYRGYVTRVGPDDYDPSSLDVVPVADPNQVSDLQKMARAEFLKELIADPYLDPLEVRQRILAAGNFEDIDKLLVQKPADDPKVLEAADKIEVSKRRAEIEAALAEAQIAEIESKIMLNIAKAESEEAGPQIEEYKQQMAVLRERVKGKMKPNGQGKVSGVAGKPSN